MVKIDISDSLYRKLLSSVVSFDDTPEAVILRLMNKETAGDSAPPERKTFHGNNTAPIGANNLEEARAIYPLAKQVFEAFETDVSEGRRKMADAINQLHIEIGLHKGSARIYIDVVRLMKQGKRYTRAINKTATQYFLEQIYEEYGKDSLATALKSLWGHVEYRDDDNLNSRGIKEIYTKFALMLKPDAEICPECGYVFFRGNGWEGLDAHWNSRHANDTNMPYAVAGPLIMSGEYKSQTQ